jgi:hypothetical protein
VTYYKIHAVVKYYEMEVSDVVEQRFCGKTSPYVSVHHVQGPSEVNYNEQILPLGIYLVHQ